MRHIISILLENEPGALSRVVGLFSARGYNIETLTVAPTEDKSLSRLTIVTSGSDDVIEQSAIQMEDEGGAAAANADPEQLVEDFKQFLEDVQPDQFGSDD